MLPLVVVVYRCGGYAEAPAQRSQYKSATTPRAARLWGVKARFGGSRMGGWVGAAITEAASLLLAELEEVAHAELKNLVPAAGRGAGRQ